MGFPFEAYFFKSVTFNWACDSKVPASTKYATFKSIRAHQAPTFDQGVTFSHLWSPEVPISDKKALS